VADWLACYLMVRSPAPSATVKLDAAVAGVTKTVLHMARARLGVTVEHVGKETLWSLPPKGITPMTEPEPDSVREALADYHKPPKDVVPHGRPDAPLPTGFGIEVVSNDIDEDDVRREAETVNLVRKPIYGVEWNEVM
jgi:hypothetical protein